VHASAHAPSHTHTHTHAHTHTHTHTHTHAHTPAHKHKHTHTHTLQDPCAEQQKYDTYTMRLSLWKVFPIHHSCTRQDLSAPSTCWYGLYSIVMTSLRLLFARHLSILCRTYARSWAQFSVNFQVITTVSKTISCYYKIQKLQLAFASFGTKIVVLPLRHTIVYAPMQKQCGDCCFAGEIQQHSSTLYRFICHSPALLFSWSLAQSFTVSHSSSILLRSRRPQWL